MWSNCLFVALGGGLGAVGEVSAQPDCRPMVLSGDDPAHQFSGGGGHRRCSPGGGTAAHVQKCSSVLKTGLCGGFTTFSTFHWRRWSYWSRGDGPPGQGTSWPAWVCAWQGCCWGGPWCGRSFEDGDPHLRAAPLSK